METGLLIPFGYGVSNGTSHGSVHQQIVGLRKFVRESFRNIRELLDGKDANPARARLKLAEHIDKIMLLPSGKEEIPYRGDWNLLGYSDGAEGPNRTERSTTYPVVAFHIRVAA